MGHFSASRSRAFSIGMLGLMALGACSSTESTQAMNAIGGAAGAIIGSQVGGVGGQIISNLGSNAGTVATALDSSEQGEKLQAAQASEQIVAQTGRSSNLAMERYLQGMVDRLADASKRVAPTDRSYTYEVTLLDSDVFNAATPGGGKVLVFEGLLIHARTEGQVAAVLAHEIAHVIKRHPKRSQRTVAAAKVGAAVLGGLAPELSSGQLGGAVGLGANAVVSGFSREAEHEADKVGIEIMHAAGYDAREMIAIQRVMASLNKGAFNPFFASHPAGEARISAAQKNWQAVTGGNASGVADSSAYQKLASHYR